MLNITTPSAPWEPLPRTEVINAVERRCPSRIPLIQAKWWEEGLREQYGDRLREFDRIPDDVALLLIESPISAQKMNLPWEWPAEGAGAYDAARAHLKTGLTIAAHTTIGPVLEELEVLRQEGVDPGAFIWVHANADPDERRHVAVAELGAWVEFDGVAEPVDADVQRLAHMKAHGLLDRVLLSHDAGWFNPAKPGGGPADYKGYTVLFERLLPALRAQGFTEDEITQIIVRNPANALAIGIKKFTDDR